MSSATLNFAAGTYSVNGTSYALSAVPGLSITGPSQGGYAQTSAGALTTFAANAARVTDLGLLIEQASTNLMPSGELPAGTSGQTDPSGSTGAVELSSSGGYYWNGGPVVDGTTQTLSWYVQSAGSNPAQFLQFAFNPDFTGYQAYANFDIINGLVTQSYGCTASIQQLGSTSWYRCIISFTPVINYYELFCYWNLISSGTQGWFGSNVSTAVTFNYWCFQQENGSAASSPILSNAYGTAARSADAATYTYSPAASSASVVTAEGSNSVSPTSPIDFGADTSGAWVGSYVQTLQVGSSGSNYTVTLTANVALTAPSLKGVNHLVKANGVSATLSVKALSALRPASVASSAKALKNASLVRNAGGSAGSFALKAMVVNKPATATQAAILATIKMRLVAVVAVGAAAAVIGRAIAALRASAQTPSSVSVKAISALRPANGIASSSAIKAVATFKSSAASQSASVATVKSRFLTLSATGTASAVIIKAVSALRLSVAALASLLLKSVQATRPAATAPFSAVQKGVAANRLSNAAAASTLTELKSRLITLSAYGAASSTLAKAIVALRASSASATAFALKIVFLNRTASGSAAAITLKSAAKAQSSSASVSSVLNVNAGTLSQALFAAAQAASSLKRSIGKLGASSQSPSSVLEKSIAALRVGFTSASAIVIKTAARAFSNSGSASGFVSAFKSHIVAFVANAGAGLASILRQIGAERPAAAVNAATVTKASMKAQQASESAGGLLTRQRFALLSLKSYAGAAAAIALLHRLSLFSSAGLSSFLSSSKTSAPPFNSAAAIVIIGHASKSTLIGGAADGVIMGHATRSTLIGSN